MTTHWLRPSTTAPISATALAPPSSRAASLPLDAFRMRDGSTIRIALGPKRGLFVPWSPTASSERMYLVQAPEELRALNRHLYDARGHVRREVVDAFRTRSCDDTRLSGGECFDGGRDTPHPTRHAATTTTTTSAPLAGPHKTRPAVRPAVVAAPAAPTARPASPAPATETQPVSAAACPSPSRLSPTSVLVTEREHKLEARVRQLRSRLASADVEIEQLRATVRELTIERDVLRRSSSRKATRTDGAAASGGGGAATSNAGADREVARRVRELEQMLEEAREKLRHAQTTVATHRDARHESDATATRLRESLVGTNLQIIVLKKQLDEKKRALDANAIRLAELELELERRRSEIAAANGVVGGGGGGQGGGGGSRRSARVVKAHAGDTAANKKDDDNDDDSFYSDSEASVSGRSVSSGADETVVAQLEREIERLRDEMRVNRKKLQRARQDLAAAEEQNERLETDNSALKVVLESSIASSVRPTSSSSSSSSPVSSPASSSRRTTRSGSVRTPSIDASDGAGDGRTRTERKR